METPAAQRLREPATDSQSATATLLRLAAVRELGPARRLVRQLEQSHRYGWRPVGDRENNYGIINLGSDPGYALIERVTNAIDAVIELEAERHPGRYGPRSPRDAVQQWFGIPGGRVVNAEPQARRTTAELISVRLRDGDTGKRPSIEIRDRGVGLTPEQIPHTILSLGESNKIDKTYLAGAYGQGGSTVLGFSPGGTLFLSRRQPELLPAGAPDLVSVTFARYRDLDPRYNKNGRYEYLVNPGRNVPCFPAGQLPEFSPGTLVLHFNLAIERYAATLDRATGSLRWLLQNALFDPVLPISAEELRSRRSLECDSQHLVFCGNHEALCRGSERVEHSGNLEVLLQHARSRSRVRVYYWVMRESEDGNHKQPIDVFVDPSQPVVYTYFGQTHGADQRRFVTERLGLPYLSKFLILQVELDNLAPTARRELLSTTRDRLKQSELYDVMRTRIAAALAADPQLQRLNAARKESILSRHSENQRRHMRERFARLMRRYLAGVDAWAAVEGDRQPERGADEETSAEELESLPTQADPSFLRIANRRRPIRVVRDHLAVVRLESDAPDGYLLQHEHARLLPATEPEEQLVLESVSDFRGGRARMILKSGATAAAGRRGVLTVYLLTRTAAVISAAADFEIVDEPEKEAPEGRDRTRVKAPEPIPVHEDQWPEFGWDETSVAEVRVEPARTNIFVNMDNRHLRRLLDSGEYQEAGHRRVYNSFLLYAAFHTWLQHRHLAAETSGLEGEAFERHLQMELDRAAQTVIHSISGEARLEQ